MTFSFAMAASLCTLQVYITSGIASIGLKVVEHVPTGRWRSTVQQTGGSMRYLELTKHI
jgi:hypothetical protein